MLYQLTKIFSFGLFIVALRIATIIRQQLHVMPLTHVCSFFLINRSSLFNRALVLVIEWFGGQLRIDFPSEISKFFVIARAFRLITQWGKFTFSLLIFGHSLFICIVDNQNRQLTVNPTVKIIFSIKSVFPSLIDKL